MPAPTIPIYSGTVPQRTQSAVDFANNADDWLAYQAPLAADYNSLATYIDGIAVTIDADATAAANSATAAANSEAVAVASANFKGTWSSLSGALNKPASVLHNDEYWQLLNNLADVTASEPSVTGDWASTTVPNKVAPKTAGATLSTALPNELQDGSTFIMPLANSVAANSYVDIELPKTYSSFTPTVQRSGSDLFRDETGTHTDILFEGATSIRLTSNGSNEWRI